MIERDELNADNRFGDLGRAVYGNGWRVMAWERSPSGMPFVVGATWDGGWIGSDWHTLTHLDTGPFVAYCRGDMPPAVVADWLEENRVGLPPEAYTLLRSQVAAANLLTGVPPA